MANNIKNIGASGDRDAFQGVLSAQEGLLSYANIEAQTQFGAALKIKSFSVLSAALSGATSNIGTNSITAGWLVFGVLVKVITAITSAAATTFSVGDGTTATKWGTGLAIAAGTSTTLANFVAATTVATSHPLFYAAAANIVLTPNTGTFTGGTVRATVFYMDMTAVLG